MTQPLSTWTGMRSLGFASLSAIALACSSNGSPLPDGMNNNTGATAGSPVSSGGSNGGGGMVTPQAGTDSGGAPAAGTSSGGSAGESTAGSGGSGSDFITTPEGKIPNLSMPPGKVGVPRDNYTDDLISPTLEEGHHQNQPIVVNGYVEGAGNAELVFYDISDPTAPVMLSRATSPKFDPSAGPKGVGEAESHQTSLARYGNKFYQVLTTGLGVDIWDITDAKKVRHVKEVALPNVNYGDFTEAVWGMYWQGTTIYIGGTNTGLHVLDATDPENVTLIKSIPTSGIGGISAGPLWAVGTTLVITTPKESGGIATMDISDPHNPQPLAAIKPAKSYIGGFYGHHAWLQSPLRCWDVLTNPVNIGAADKPLASVTTEASEYVSFADGTLYLGHLRPNAGVTKYDIRDLSNIVKGTRVWGRLQFTNGDDQFSIQVGSLVVLADDELPYRGMVIAAHSTEPDTAAPAVDTVVPNNGKTGVNKKANIGLSLTDNIELATVHPGSVIVRPMGGEQLEGNWGLYMGVLNFDPKEDLLPNTTYEVILPKDGIKDLVGNGIAAEFKSTFTTGP